MIVAFAASVVAEPKMPHVFYGDVLVGGSPAGDGTAVTAEIGGTPYGSTTTSGGSYALEVSADDLQTGGVEGGVNGETVSIYVGGQPASTQTFASGNIDPLDLSVEQICVPTGDEICDDIDNDCDGEVDEDFELGGECSEGLGVCETPGVIVCNQAGDGTECNAMPSLIEPSAELCDGLDNDCDGETDEDFPTLDDVCSVGVGECEAEGVTVCTGDFTGTQCNAEPGVAVDELCDGADNDCDGETDEDFTDLEDVCFAGTGVCEETGAYVCTQDGLGTECDAVASEPPVESEAGFCSDGNDNDCDGDTDENDFDCQDCQNEDTVGCPLQDGVCAGSEQVCTVNVWPGCDYSFYSPDYEETETSCTDGLDNDCDSYADCDDVDCFMTCTEQNCVDGLDNDEDGDTDCEDSDCSADMNCIYSDLCLVITDFELLDSEFNPVESIDNGDFYNIRAYNHNRCDEPVEAMHLIQITDSQATPIHLGTTITVINPGETQPFSVGTTMSSGAGTYNAHVMNWNGWVSQPGWEAMSISDGFSFDVN